MGAVAMPVVIMGMVVVPMSGRGVALVCVVIVILRARFGPFGSSVEGHEGQPPGVEGGQAGGQEADHEGEGRDPAM